mmetsp:Transcript_11130/g.11151  ORF Transcript_11130/g.11151 Transcript_11130/m.11151 type:complete len:100 (+) Transcript_11130:261-560(+)
MLENENRIAITNDALSFSAQHNSTFKKSGHGVQFADVVANSMLIPTRSEIISLALANSLWWSKKDYKEFRKSARKEMKSLRIKRNLRNYIGKDKNDYVC